MKGEVLLELGTARMRRFDVKGTIAMKPPKGKPGRFGNLRVQGTMRLLQVSAQVRVTVIGEMDEQPEQRPRLMDASGVEIKLPEAGWDHLRPDADARRGQSQTGARPGPSGRA